MSDLSAWTPRERPEPVTLEGRYVRIEPLSSAHYSDLYALTGEAAPEVDWTYLPAVEPVGLANFWMTMAPLVDSEDDIAFAVVPLEGPSAGRVAGTISFLRIEPNHGQVEVGWVILGDGLRGTRAATEAFHLLMVYAFDELGYRRFEWKCDSANAPSRAAAYRLGFTHEGTFRHHMVVKGRNRDTDWFSITDEEWPGVKARHEAWLSPDNFDDAGQQRQRLAR